MQWVDEEPDEFTETDVWSRQSINGERQTWRQLYERAEAERQALQHRSVILSDLNRCEHGRHAGDVCSNCNGPSHGNPRLSDDRIVGFDISGNGWRVPDHTSSPAEAWH
jgi:acyl-CoA synthetase (AMP-forming)/AMP-acid ligase II